MRPVITFLDGHTLNPGDLSWDRLTILGKFNVFDRTAIEQIHDRVSNTEILIVNKFPVNEGTLSHMPNLKYVVVAATGYNNVDTQAVKDAGIPVSNVTGYSTESVAQHVFSFILRHYNQIEYYAEQVRNGAWSQSPDFCFYHHSIKALSGKTLGIFGYGTIGHRVGELGNQFGMKVISSTGNMQKTKPDYVEFADPEILFSNSDILTLHAPLTASTKYIVNQDTLRLMKPASIIINTSRGPLVNEGDLLRALDQEKLAAAYLDVLEAEPPEASNPLIGHSKCFITPHIAWAGFESRIKLMEGIAQNIQNFLEGNIINRVA